MKLYLLLWLWVQAQVCLVKIPTIEMPSQLNKIAFGWHGEVYTGQLNQKKVILKKIVTGKMLEYRQKGLYREACFLAQLSPSPFFPNLYGMASKSDLVMEYIDGIPGVKFMRLKNRKDYMAAVKYVFRQMVLAAQSMAQHKVVHSDLYLRNVMITPNLDVKIIDFGNAFQQGERISPTRITGKAPEMLVPGLKATFQSITYVLGVFLHQMVKGRASTLDGLTPFAPGRRTGHAQVDDLLNKLWSIRPNQRPSYEEILAHPFVARTIKPLTPYFTEQEIAQNNPHSKFCQQKHEDLPWYCYLLVQLDILE